MEYAKGGCLVGGSPLFVEAMCPLWAAAVRKRQKERLQPVKVAAVLQYHDSLFQPI